MKKIVLITALIIGAVSAQAAVVTYDFDSGMDGVSADLTGGTMTYAIGTNSDGEPTAAARAWNQVGASGEYELNIGQRGVGNSGVADAAFDLGAASQLTFALNPNAGESLDFSVAGLSFDSLIYNDASGATLGFGYKIWADTGEGFVAVGVLQSTGYTGGVGTGDRLLATDESTELDGFVLDNNGVNLVVTPYSFNLSSIGVLATDQAVTLAITISGDRNNQFGYGNSMDDLVVGGITVVPEPATVGMLGLGALVALLVRRMQA